MLLVNRGSSTSDEGPRLLRDVWGFTATAMVIVILRVVAKWRIGKFGVDDVLMGFALFLTTIGAAMITVATKHGFGKEVNDLTDGNVSKIIMFDYIAQAFGLAGGALGRVSFIVFVLGLLVSTQWHRVVFWALIALQLVVNSVFIIILFVQCPGHASAIWEHSDKEKCWNTRVQAYFGYFQGAFNSATDLYLAVFSTVIFWRLNLKLKIRMGLVALLGLGIFAMAAAIVKTVQTRVLASYDIDPTVATVNYDRWLYIETNLVMITASIPCIRSLLRSMNGPRSPGGHSHELSSRYVGSSSAPTAKTRNRESSEGKGIVNAFEGHASSDDVCHEDHDDIHDSGYSRESVMNCV